jgi:hypothetical protein
MDYKAGHFLNYYNERLGKDLWAFLNDHDSIVRMETASLLRRPAVEPLSELLIQKFGKKVREDIIKQMIGHMVRQIMERRGFKLEAKNIAIRFGTLFSRAARYGRMK